MPGGDSVLAGRQVRQLEDPSTLAHVVVRRLEHGKVAMHPGMDAALHGDEFFLLVLLGNGRRAGRLRFIPLAVRFGLRVYVVRGRVAIDDLEFLVRVHDHNVRKILAAFLLESDRPRRNLTVIGGSGRDVHHHVFQCMVRAGYNRFVGHGRRMLPGTGWFSGHIDGFLFGWRSRVSHLAANRSSQHQRLTGKQDQERRQYLLSAHFGASFRWLRSSY